MRKLPPQEERIKRAIRDAIVIDPLISISKLQEALYDKGFKTSNNTPLNWHYLARLREKIHRQNVEQVNRQQVSERIALLKEKNRLAFERFVRIAYYADDMRKDGIPPPSNKDMIAAVTAMVRLELLIFNAELDAGIFERHLGTVEIEKRNKPVSAEQREKIRQALINWGLISKELPPDDSATTTTSITIPE